MTTRVKYRDIPEVERKRLATEVRRKSSFLSTVLVTMICSWFLSDRIAAIIFPRQSSFWLNLLANGVALLCLSGGSAWILMGPVLRRAVENENSLTKR
jgi:hypothetical protein